VTEVTEGKERERERRRESADVKMRRCDEDVMKI